MTSTITPALTTQSQPTVGHERLRQQAVELEGVFLTTLMKEMFASLQTDESQFGGGFAEETWRGMQAEQLAGAMAEAGGIGLADAILGDLIALQSSQPATPQPLPHGAYK